MLHEATFFMCHIRDYVFAENKFVSEPIHRASRVVVAVVVDEGREFTRQQFYVQICAVRTFFLSPCLKSIMTDLCLQFIWN